MLGRPGVNAVSLEHCQARVWKLELNSCFDLDPFAPVVAVGLGKGLHLYWVEAEACASASGRSDYV